MNARTIRTRATGQQHGLIRRMVSPHELGEVLKPFIFLDHFEGETSRGAGFGFHPHSGIATLTYVLDADTTYEDTTGKSGVLRARGLEWMQAGGGVWHQGGVVPRVPYVTGFQLWVSLPPSHEEAPAFSQYLPPEEVPIVDGVSVLLGSYEGRQNPIPVPQAMNYLHAQLEPGRRWTYQPPAGHQLAWAYVHRGRAAINGETLERTLAVFEDGAGALEFEALAPTQILLGSAARHEHPLVLGTSSVHTNAASLHASLQRIRTIGGDLRRAGRI